MLRVEMRALAQGPVETRGSIAAGDPLFEGLDFELGEQVRVRGKLADAGPGRYYWRAKLSTSVGTACCRCLQSVSVELAATVEVLFTDDQTTDDPSAYVIPTRATFLDLREAIREELILAAPEYVLCRDDCRGLCAGCGIDLNNGECKCVPEPDDPRWLALEALRSSRARDTG